MSSLERAGSVGRLQHVGVVTCDLSGMLRFFHDLLGFPVLKRWRSNDGKISFAMLDAGGANIELLGLGSENDTLNHESDLRQPGLRHLCFSVKSVDAFRKRLEESGIPIIVQPRPGQYFRRYLFCQAPEGVLVELVEE